MNQLGKTGDGNIEKHGLGTDLFRTDEVEKSFQNMMSREDDVVGHPYKVVSDLYFSHPVLFGHLDDEFNRCWSSSHGSGVNEEVGQWFFEHWVRSSRTNFPEQFLKVFNLQF